MGRGPRLLADRRGIAAAEFAMVATVLLLFVLAILDIGASIQQRMVLQQAARGAGIYAQSFPNQTTGITEAITAALPASWTNIVTNTLLCQGESVSQSANCSAACGGNDSGSYLIVQVCRPYSPFLFQTGNCTVGGQSGNCVSYVIRVQ
jgi:Flp pilus assembly protein TadG